MVKTKKTRRQRNITSKLMAAVCMLLVSSIMMVSTTYAWFTLSTAPEVTGISTSVGANGNLEMALLPQYVADHTKLEASIGSNGETSMAVKDAKEANVTWGNLVQLESNGQNLYGLDRITL